MVSQIAISLLLLVAAGLFVRTLSGLDAIDLGFNREHLLLFSVNAQQAGLRGGKSADFTQSLQTAGNSAGGAQREPVQLRTGIGLDVVHQPENPGGIALDKKESYPTSWWAPGSWTSCRSHPGGARHRCAEQGRGAAGGGG